MIHIDKDLQLPDSLRDELRKPFGRLLESAQIATILTDSNDPLVTIGDSVSISLIKKGINPSLVIWDSKTRRTPCDAETLRILGEYAPIKGASNPAGTITKEAWDLVTNSLKEKQASVLIDGEEDLLVIPVILNSDDGTNVVYGSPGKGAILIVVDQKIKAVFQDILSRLKNDN